MTATFADRAGAYRERVDVALGHWLPPATTHPSRFHSALRYAALGAGKRLRPLLVYATGEWLGLAPERLDGIAVAIEYVHAYSLVHDDLPALDDDHLRRGRPTTHVAFDEATAILAGDALQAHAYGVLATDAALEADAATRRQLILDLARASGSQGMAGGQALDVEGDAAATPERIETIYRMKTGCLLEAAVIMPCRLRQDLDSSSLDAARRYARPLGLAFQLADDLIDVESASELMGKPRGSDERNGRATLAATIGAADARRRLDGLRAEALGALEGFGAAAEGLRWMCERAIVRDR